MSNSQNIQAQPPHRGRAGGEPSPKVMPRGAGLSFPSGAGGTQHLCSLKLRESHPQNCCVPIKGGVGGEMGAPARGWKQRGSGKEVVTLRCCGLSEGKDGMDGKEGAGHGRKVKRTPKEERDAAH